MGAISDTSRLIIFGITTCSVPSQSWTWTQRTVGRSNILIFDITIFANYYNLEWLYLNKFPPPTISLMYSLNHFYRIIITIFYLFSIFIKPSSIHEGVLEMTGKGDLILSYHAFPYVINILHSSLTFHFYFIILIISLCFYLYIFTIPTWYKLSVISMHLDWE